MKTKKSLSLIIIAMAFVFLITGIGQADTPAPGEEALFTTSTAPDALFLMDLSGSMDWNPAGGSNISVQFFLLRHILQFLRHRS